jgi:endonuclease/exonuclease/phosphatase family metal-dependent hydrolase
LSAISSDIPAIAYSQLKIATFNLFNYLEPPNAYYDFENIYSAEQWLKKQGWISDYLIQHQPDVIGFQEVFSPESLQRLVAIQGYPYFSVIDSPDIVDDFIYRDPVVAIASKFPLLDVQAIQADQSLVALLGLPAEFSFSRQILRATITLPHIGNTDCYVVHFKSKRPMLEHDDDTSLSPEKNIIEKLKHQVLGSWGSSIQRGSEATLLLANMIERREVTQYPMVLMGDFNNNLADGILSQLLTNQLRFASNIDCVAYLANYCLQDAWQLYQNVQRNNFYNAAVECPNMTNKPVEVTDTELVAVDNSQSQCSTTTFEEMPRPPSHYFGASGSVLDYILMSCEFDASYHDSMFEVHQHDTYDQHLINPIYERDSQSTDHGIVMVTLALRS